MINHGVEYRIELNPTFYGSPSFYILQSGFIKRFQSKWIEVSWEREYITIADTNKTDDRLLESTYYANNKEHWFESNVPMVEYNEDIDISLTDAEKQYLDFIISMTLPTNIVRHGWYEVVKHQ